MKLKLFQYEKGLPEYKLDILLDCTPKLVPDKDDRYNNSN